MLPIPPSYLFRGVHSAWTEPEIACPPPEPPRGGGPLRRGGEALACLNRHLARLAVPRRRSGSLAAGPA